MAAMSTTRSLRTSGRPSRRAEYSESTRSALVGSAIELFTEGGYAATSLDAVAAAARVTKGALYHHFPGGKKALFEAAFEQVEEQLNQRVVAEAQANNGTPWESSAAALGAFLDTCLEPVYRRVIWEEGPHALGFGTWWEMEQRHALGLISAMLSKLMDSGLIERMPVDPLARSLGGALAAAACAMSEAEDPRGVRDGFEEVLTRMLRGLAPAAPPPA
jgi:AcrR family transcriptional regulator